MGGSSPLPHLATAICEKTATSRLGFSCFPRDYVTLILSPLLNPTAFHILQIPKDTTTTVYFMYVYKNLPFPFHSIEQPLYSSKQLVLAAIPLNSSLICVYREQLCEENAFPFRCNVQNKTKEGGRG
jgi:hypothetical protein